MARPDRAKYPTHTPRAGGIRPKSPDNSHTITSVENGVLAAAAKNPAVPSRTNAAGGGAQVGPSGWRISPSAPPPHPPIKSAGPNTPPDPPLPTVRLVVTNFPTAIAPSNPAVNASGRESTS